MKNKFLMVFLLVILISTVSLGCTGYDVSENPIPSIPKVTTKTPEQINIEACEKIVKDYHSTHTYIGKDIYVCADMAEDIWNMVVTKGMNAEIKVGNIDQDITDLKNANHAWVIAETGNDNWLALETTGGYVVYYEDNPRYYHGWNFKNPRDFREYLALKKLYNEQVEKYNQALADYNYLVEIYNRSDNNTKWAMVSQINTKIEICNARVRDMNETMDKITNLMKKN